MAHHFLIFQLYCLLAVAIGFASADEPERIISGHDAAPGEFPHMVSLKEYGHHFCGGAIISPNHILTAAHCLYPRTNYSYDDLSVVSGTIKLNNDGEVHKVSNMFLHPEFNPKRVWIHDIAVIKLASPITFNRLQQPIRLPTAEPHAHVVAVVSGWGYDSIDSGKSPFILKKLRGAILNKEVCETRHTVKLIKENICMITPLGQGVCSGDSGSALVHKGVVIGIISSSVSCALEYPDIYAMVYGELKFINEAMSK